MYRRSDEHCHALIEGTTFADSDGQHAQEAELMTRLYRVYWHTHVDDFRRIMEEAGREAFHATVVAAPPFAYVDLCGNSAKE